MLKKILIGLAAIIALILIAAAFQPDTFKVQRTGTIAAPPVVVYGQLNDFHNWSKFNPWNDLDTTAVLTYTGEASGPGSIYNWVGNSNMGKGRMTMVESTPDHVKVDMEFFEPFAGKAVSEYHLRTVDGGTEMTQTMSGENNFIGKLMCLFMDQDKMVGDMFEKGFERMNTVTRNMATSAATGPAVFTREFDAPVANVWDAWTRPEEHMKWWGPRMFTCPAARMDVKPGGTYHVAMRGPDGKDYWNTGTYREVVPLKKLVYTVQFADSLGNVVPAAQLGMPGNWPEAVLTTSTFEEVNGRTRFTLTEEGVPAEMRAMSEQGMNECLEKLAATLRK